MNTTHFPGDEEIGETLCGKLMEELPEGDQWSEERCEVDCSRCWDVRDRRDQAAADYDGSYREHAAYLRSDR